MLEPVPVPWSKTIYESMDGETYSTFEEASHWNHILAFERIINEAIKSAGYSSASFDHRTITMIRRLMDQPGFPEALQRYLEGMKG